MSEGHPPCGSKSEAVVVRAFNESSSCSNDLFSELTVIAEVAQLLLHPRIEKGEVCTAASRALDPSRIRTPARILGLDGVRASDVGRIRVRGSELARSEPREAAEAPAASRGSDLARIRASDAPTILAKAAVERVLFVAVLLMLSAGGTGTR